MAVGAQTLAVTDKGWRRLGSDCGDILGGYRVRFVFGEEGEIRSNQTASDSHEVLASNPR